MHHNLPSRDEFEEYLNDWIRRQPFQLPVVPLTQHRPYPIEIEAEEFPRGFTMPNLDRFNGKGNPHEHLMKFTLTLGNIAYNPNFCFQLFGSSLTGDAFQWYLTLPTGSVRTWEEMHRLFVGRLFVMQRDVTIADLSNMRQRPNETVDAYIERWQKEANRCHPPEAEQVQLCRNGIRDDIALVLSEQIASFTLLAKEAHNKERVLALTSRGHLSLLAKEAI